MKSLNQMIAQIEGLSGTKDVTEWESEFIDSVVKRTDSGKIAGSLSDKQIAIIERIYGKHFA